MKSLTSLPPTTSASSTSTPGSLSESRASISAWIALIKFPIFMKKAGERPLFRDLWPTKSCGYL